MKTVRSLRLCPSAPLRPVPVLFMMLMSCFTSLVAADAAVPTPPKPTPAAQPAALDAATSRKAEAAADAYLKQANTRPDPLAETALAEIEVLLLEVHAFLEVKQPLKAGERYLSAIEKRRSIADEQRPLLGKRLHQADLDLVSMSRQLLGQSAFDLGPPPAAQPVAGTPADPAAPPAGQPAK